MITYTLSVYIKFTQQIIENLKNLLSQDWEGNTCADILTKTNLNLQLGISPFPDPSNVITN